MKILLLILAMFITGNANAMDGELPDEITSVDQTAEHNVTVGRVDESLQTYDIEINWGLLEFDYVYDEETDSYKWQHPHGTSEGYFAITNNNHTNYPVIPTITWNSSEKYDFVKGIIKEEAYTCIETEYNEEQFNSGEIITGADCTNYQYPGVTYEPNKYYYLGADLFEIYENKPVGGNPSGIEGMYSYGLYLSLENDSTKEAKTPAMGDTIGTLTITFEAAN